MTNSQHVSASLLNMSLSHRPLRQAQRIAFCNHLITPHRRVCGGASHFCKCPYRRALFACPENPIFHRPWYWLNLATAMGAHATDEEGQAVIKGLISQSIPISHMRIY